jgi:nucleotide-binding universal stress UspA family protein
MRPPPLRLFKGHMALARGDAGSDHGAMTRIVVGIDGSPGSRQALAWAVEEAHRRGASLHVVAAWSFPALAGLTPIPAPTLDEFRQMASDALDDVVDVTVPGDVEVTRHVLQGKPAAVLAGEPSNGDLLVVGRRGMGGFERLILGSVSRGVLRRSHAPTVVVPEHAKRDGDVIVGVSGGPEDDEVIAAAIGYARSEHVTCRLLHAVELGVGAAGLGASRALEVMVEAGAQILGAAVDRAETTGVDVEGSAVLGSPAAVLCDAAEDAQLLVVGRRSHGILGSVAEACASHAACPVLVLPSA